MDCLRPSTGAIGAYKFPGTDLGKQTFLRITVNRWLCRFPRRDTGSHAKTTRVNFLRIALFSADYVMIEKCVCGEMRLLSEQRRFY